MKNNSHISQLTLELYHKGLASRKEKKEVEAALKTNPVFRKKYEALLESEREINLQIEKELARLNIPQTPAAVTQPYRKRFVVGIILAAAILLCALIPAILYLKSGGSNNNSTITEETTRETEDIYTEDKTPSPESPPVNERTVITESPKNESSQAAEQKIARESKEINTGGTEVAVIPETGVHTRGGGTEELQPNISVPPGLTVILENMFSDSGLTHVVIPPRITSIGKNAFSGNPLVSITIGANVALEDTAFPGNFSNVYNSYGRAAGTYTRPDTVSGAWIKN
jgi:hypothetical protein